MTNWSLKFFCDPLKARYWPRIFDELFRSTTKTFYEIFCKIKKNIFVDNKWKNEFIRIQQMEFASRVSWLGCDRCYDHHRNYIHILLLDQVHSALNKLQIEDRGHDCHWPIMLGAAQHDVFLLNIRAVYPLNSPIIYLLEKSYQSFSKMISIARLRFVIFELTKC